MTMLRALADFAYEDAGGELIYVKRGVTRVSSTHPMLADSRHLFEPVRGLGSDSDTRTACRALDANGKLIEDRRS